MDWPAYFVGVVIGTVLVSVARAAWRQASASDRLQDWLDGTHDEGDVLDRVKQLRAAGRDRFTATQQELPNVNVKR